MQSGTIMQKEKGGREGRGKQENTESTWDRKEEVGTV